MIAAAFSKVIPLLENSGIRTQLIRCVPDEATADVSGQVAPPRLMIYADGGWRVATISVAVRSGAYRVELARIGPHNEELPDRVEIVPERRPARVATLVSATMGSV